MDFVEYDETSGPHYDSSTRIPLDELRLRHGKVEVKHISASEFCIRIRTKITGMDIAMATMGSTVLEAAERMLRVMNPPT